MHERIKEHDGDIRQSRSQTSAVSEHANATGHYQLWDKAYVYWSQWTTTSFMSLSVEVN